MTQINSKSSPQVSSNTLQDVFHSQKKILHLFLSNPHTRTPIIVLYVASFGGALHAAVTTYFYLAIGASEIDIGHFGFIMSVGALVGSPISGIALDKYGPWIPISVTAGACAWGCLWRGVASSLYSLRLGAILLGIGVNMWTVVLGHLVKSFPSSMRSEVLSGFGVQMTVLQLIGKGVFPLVEYGLHHVVGLEDSLLRYRIHMGMCTFFCFYGTFALFWDRKNVVQDSSDSSNSRKDSMVKYQEKHSDIVDEFTEEGATEDILQSPSTPIYTAEIELVLPLNTDTSIHGSVILERSTRDSFADNSSNSESSTFLNEPPIEHDSKARISLAEDTNNSRSHSQLIMTITLAFALLLQSIATTILAVLWPLLAHDRFNLSAHTFGILTFISSVVSTGAVAAFPVIERSEKVGGRVRCAALGFGLGSILCVLFCFCSFYDYWTEAEVDTNLDTEESRTIIGDTSTVQTMEGNETIQQQVNSRNQFLFHAVSAMLFQAALCFLEPSLKSILSLVVNSSSSSKAKRSSLGGTVGLMQMLGNLGGGIGNLSGTFLYKLSKDMSSNNIILQGGSLPFIATAGIMAVSSVLIWRLEEPLQFRAPIAETTKGGDHSAACDADVERGQCSVDSEEDPENDRPDGCCLALRETTYDLKLD